MPLSGQQKVMLFCVILWKSSSLNISSSYQRGNDYLFSFFFFFPEKNTIVFVLKKEKKANDIEHIEIWKDWHICQSLK